MKLKCQYQASVVDGQLVPNSAKYARHMLKQMNGKHGLVTFDPQRKTRSLSQNAYYWGVYLPTFAEHTGHTPEELHDVFKAQYGKKYLVKFHGKEHIIAASTTEYSKHEFTEYLEKLDREAAELGLTIPRPEDLEGYVPH